MDDRPGLTNKIRLVDVSTPVKGVEFVCEVGVMIVGGSVPVLYTWNIKSNPPPFYYIP